MGGFISSKSVQAMRWEADLSLFCRMPVRLLEVGDVIEWKQPGRYLGGVVDVHTGGIGFLRLCQLMRYKNAEWDGVMRLQPVIARPVRVLWGLDDEVGVYGLDETDRVLRALAV